MFAFTMNFLSLLFTLYHANCIWQLLLKNFMMMMLMMMINTRLQISWQSIKMLLFKCTCTAPAHQMINGFHTFFC